MEGTGKGEGKGEGVFRGGWVGSGGEGVGSGVWGVGCGEWGVEEREWREDLISLLYTAPRFTTPNPTRLSPPASPPGPTPKIPQNPARILHRT